MYRIDLKLHEFENFSNSSIVKSGIPQGSVLSQILFVLYINDLPSIFSLKIHIDLFADDTKIYFSYASESERFLLQNNLNLFSQWVNKWIFHYQNVQL